MSTELTDEERRSNETREWEKVVAGGGCHRKGNVRLFGTVRFLRFKLSKGPKKFLTFHPKETPLATFRLGRTAWAVVRQNGCQFNSFGGCITCKYAAFIIYAITSDRKPPHAPPKAGITIL